MESLLDKIVNIDINTGGLLSKNILYRESFMLKEQGHNLELKSLIINKELLTLSRHLFKITKPKIKYMDNDIQFRINQIGNARSFFNKYFKLHKVNNFDQKKYNPLDIDIVYTDIKPFSGYLNIIDTSINNNHELLFNIILSKHTNILTGLIYSHEITHSQLYTNKGIIKELYNSEILPIFVELLYLYEYKDSSDNLIALHNFIRLKGLIKFINTATCYQIFNFELYSDIVSSNTYVISTITAYKLFNIYLNGDNKLKSYIIYRIQNIFDGNLTLEEFLEEFNLSWLNNDYKVKEKF